MPNLKAAEQFERERLRGVFSQAMLGALLHRITACVGAATITWATVVVMGGFASEVSISDFVQVTFLVIEIACLLGLALLSSKLVTKRSLCRGSLDPVYLSYKDERLNIITIIQNVSMLVQFVMFILPCAHMSFSTLRREEFKAIHTQTLLFSAWRRPELGFATSNSTSMILDLQACLHKCGTVSASNITINDISSCVKACFPEPMAMVSNLQVCLFTFHCLVLGTCILASSCLGYIATECFLMQKTDLSLKKYHDEVMSRALNVGLVEADEFDTWELFLKWLAEDLAIRNIGPLEVKKQNSEFISYCYNHPKGVEMVIEGLASADPMRQQVAASIVGFWARRHDVEKNTPLLRKLAEKLGLPGKTAEAAVNSFSALAVEWRNREESPLLKIRPVAGADGGVVEKVVDLVLRTRLPSLQVYVRLLDNLFMSRSVWHWLASNKSQDLADMKAKLLSIANQEEGARRRRRPEIGRAGEVNANIDASIRARTGFYALSAWVRIMELENAASGNIDASTNNPHGTTDTSYMNACTSQQVSPKSSTDHVKNDVASGTKVGNNDHNHVVNGTSSASEEVSQRNTNHNRVMGDASTRADHNDVVNGARASENFQEVFQSNSNGIITSDINGVDDWRTQARRLLEKLDERLQHQEFMWYTDAARFRELGDKFPCSRALGTWLKTCEIRGEEYENLP